MNPLRKNPGIAENTFKINSNVYVNGEDFHMKTIYARHESSGRKFRNRTKYIENQVQYVYVNCKNSHMKTIYGGH